MPNELFEMIATKKCWLQSFTCVPRLPQVRRMINVQAAKNNFSQLLGPALRSAKPEDKPQVRRHLKRIELLSYNSLWGGCGRNVQR